MLTDNVNVEELKKKRQYAILKAAIIVFAVVVVFAVSFVLFTALSGTFSFSDDLTADAWNLSGISGVSTSGGANWFVEPKTWSSGTSILTMPNTSITGYNGFSGTFNTEKGYPTGGATWNCFLMYEIILNDNEVAAISAGYINSVSFKAYMPGLIGSDFHANWGSVYYTVFIVAGSAGGGNIENFTEISGASVTGNFEGERNTVTTAPVSYTLPKGTTVVRYGITIQFNFNSEKWYWIGTPTVTFNGVNITEYTVTKKPLPKFQVTAGANGSLSSNAYASPTQLTIDGTLNSITAIPNNGYYFSGWSVSGGTIHTAVLWSSAEPNDIDRLYITLPLKEPAKVEGASNTTVTVTANFTKIPISNELNSFEYRQQNSGGAVIVGAGGVEGVRQGPMVSNISGYVFGRDSKGEGRIYVSRSGSTATTDYQSKERPSDVGDYRLEFYVYREANGHNDVYGYYVCDFSITRINLQNIFVSSGIPQVSFNEFTTGNTISERITFGEFEYSSLAIEPTLQAKGSDYLYLRYGNYMYALKENADFSWGYEGNTSVGTATATVTGTGNFTGTFTISFNINPLTITSENVYYGQERFTKDSVTYTGVSRVTTADGTMASDNWASHAAKINNAATTIQRDGKLVYNGFPQISASYITVIYIWTYAVLDVNTGEQGIVIFPIAANGKTGFVDESGTDKSISNGAISAWMGGLDETQSEQYENNIDACSYAEDGAGCASISISLTAASGNLTLDNGFKVYFDIAPLVLNESKDGALEGYAQGDDMSLIYNGNRQKQKGIQYVYFNYSAPSVSVPGIDTGTQTVIFAATEDGLASYSYDTPEGSSGFAPWEYEVNGVLYTPAKFDIGTADNDGNVIFENNVEAGTATVYIELTAENSPNIRGFIKTTYTIKPLDISSLPDASAQGHENGHEIVVRFNNGNDVVFDPNGGVEPDFKLSISNIYEESGGNFNPISYIFTASDYIAEDVVYTDNENAGTATIAIPAQGNYTGTYRTTFQILPLQLDEAGYIGYIVEEMTYMARRLNSSKDFALIFEEGYAVRIFGEDFVIPYKKSYEKVSDFDEDGPVSINIPQYELASGGYGNNTDVADSYIESANGTVTGNAYFTLTFTSVAGDNDQSPNFVGNLRVYFNIAPKALWKSADSFEYAVGTEGNDDAIETSDTIRLTYNGEPQLITDGNAVEVVYGSEKLRFGVDFVLGGADEYRSNIDAGTAYVTIEAVKDANGNYTGNYSGKCRVPFTIAPYSITRTEGYETISLLTGIALDYVRGEVVYSDPDFLTAVGYMDDTDYIYYYKNDAGGNNVIKPAITTIYVSMGNKSLPLEQGKDFEAVYDEDGSVGMKHITVRGINNYTGEADNAISFRIEAVAQTVSIDKLVTLNQGAEVSLAADELGRAAYQISVADMQSVGIKVTATTTAVSPLVGAVFTLYEILGDGNYAPVALDAAYYTVTDIVTVKTASNRSETTATIKFNTELSGYFIVAATFTNINFVTASVLPTASDTTATKYSPYSILVKNYDAVTDGVTFGGTYTYGDGSTDPGREGEITLPLALKSGTNPKNPLLTSSGEDNSGRKVIDVVGSEAGLSYIIRLANAGTATLTFSHEGYLDAADFTNAYFAFEEEAEYIVNPRPLTVYFGTATEEGALPAVNITYGSSFTPGAINNFTFIGLASWDSASDIVSGFTVNGWGVSQGKNTPDAGATVITVNGESMASKYGNYAIKKTTYRDYMVELGEWTDDSAEYLTYNNLFIEKAVLTVAAYTESGVAGSANNIIYKTYGEENPEPWSEVNENGYKLIYSGFVNGDTGLMSGTFTAPEVDYGEVDRMTGVGSHAVTVTGGESTNYVFVTAGKQTVYISPAEVNIFVFKTAVSFGGNGISVDYTVTGVLDENGEALDDFTFDTRELVFYYFSDQNNNSSYVNEPPVNAGAYGVAISYEPDNSGNYTSTSTIKYVALTKEEAARTDYSDWDIEVRQNSFSAPYWGAFEILPFNLEFGYPGYIGGILTVGYDANGLTLTSLLPSPTNEIEGYRPSGTFDKVEFRPYPEGGAWSTMEDSSSHNIMLTSGYWDVRFEYISSNSNYSGYASYVIEGMIKVSADAVRITYKEGTSGYSGIYNGTAHPLSAADFVIEFPDGKTLHGNDFSSGSPAGYGTFSYGIMPEGGVSGYDSVEEIEEYLSGLGTVAVNVGVYDIWAIYIPAAQEAEATFSTISMTTTQSNVFEITPKMLSVNDFTYNQKVLTYDAAPHTLVFGSDVMLNEGVLVGAEAQTGLPGDIRILFRKGGAEYASIIDAGTYDVVLEYSPRGGNNNYAMTEGKNVFLSGIRIDPRNVTIYYNGQTAFAYEYNGAARTITALTEPVNGVMPQGTLKYTYSDENGNPIEGSPVNVGTYTVSIEYVPTSNDNFKSGSAFNPGVTIRITKATPAIVIYPVTLSYEDAMRYAQGGDLTALYAALYRISLAGGESVNEVGSVSVSYGTAGVTFPATPGSYAIRVSFTSSSPNYNSNAQSAAGALTIRLPVPELDIEAETHTYTGTPISSDSKNVTVSLETATGAIDIYYPVGTEGTDKFYYGLINIEYRLHGSYGSWTGAPVNVGTYDVRLTYTASPEDKMFTGGSAVIENALTITPVEIKVIPVFGQGKVYDGNFADTAPIAYMYSYVSNGVMYFEYASVSDVATGYSYDISKAEYATSNYIYTVYNGRVEEGVDGKFYAEQWKDYELSDIEYASAVVIVNGQELRLELYGYEGVVEFNQNGVTYKLDTDRLLLYPADAEKLSYSVAGGLFLSYTSPDGRVYVVNVDRNSSGYVYNEAQNVASYAFTREDGVRVDATIDFDKGVANDFRGRVYTILETAGALNTANGVEYIDFGKLTDISSDGSLATYKTMDGVYLVCLDENRAIPAYDVEITAVKVGNILVALEDLTAGELPGEYIYNTSGGRYIINVADKTARKALYYAVEEEESGRYGIVVSEEKKISFSLSDDDVERLSENCYKLTREGVTYYVDLEEMTARNESNRGLFDLAQKEEGGAMHKNFRYTLYDENGNAVMKAPLYGHDIEVTAPALAGVTLNGSIGCNGALNNGYHEITGSISAPAGNNNFSISPDMPVLYYYIDRAAVDIEFIAPENLVYDGNNKIVGYEINGVVEGENVGIVLVYDGDNINVTQNGFIVTATLTGGNGNYYLVGGVSERYLIELAEMNAPVWDNRTTVTYDGLSHTVELSVDDGATVEYLSGTRFTEPGTYTISVVVTKPNYRTLTSSVTLIINKALFSVVPDIFTGKLVYGDPLPTLTANTAGIDGTQLGTVVLDPGQQLIPGTNEYTWSFLPYDPVEFYSRYDGVNGGDIRGTISLTVEKAEAEIEIFTDLEQTETNPLAIIGQINGSSLNELEGVTIEYVDGAGNRYAQMPTAAGRYTVVITYEGNELYAETVKEFVLTIQEESNLTWMYYLFGGLGLLAVASLVFFLMKRGKKYE